MPFHAQQAAEKAIEVVSALARLTRDGAISVAQRDAAAAFATDLSAWIVVEMHADMTSIARRLLLRHDLGVGDAAQLGAALFLQVAVGPLEEFVAHDARLLNAARAEQLRVRSPLKSSGEYVSQGTAAHAAGYRSG